MLPKKYQKAIQRSFPDDSSECRGPMMMLVMAIHRHENAHVLLVSLLSNPKNPEHETQKPYQRNSQSVLKT